MSRISSTFIAVGFLLSAVFLWTVGEYVLPEAGNVINTVILVQWFGFFAVFLQNEFVKEPHFPVRTRLSAIILGLISSIPGMVLVAYYITRILIWLIFVIVRFAWDIVRAIYCWLFKEQIS